LVSKLGDLSLEEVLTFKLSSYPPALFETSNILRKADKPELAQVIREYIKDFSSEAVMDTVPATDCYVLDGGSLLHRLPWDKGDSYGTIAESYAEFTVRNYGLATVVFDDKVQGLPLRITSIRRGGNLASSH
jgi:hypothetical protein